MMRKRNGWKVLTRLEDGRYFSAWMGKDRGGHVYPIKRWVGRRTGCGPNAVFENYEAALRFACYCVDNPYIACCEYVPSRSRRLSYRAKDLWGIYVDRTQSSVPNGTGFADRVKITEGPKPVRC